MNFSQVITDIEIKTIAELAREIWTEHYIAIIDIDQVEYMLGKFQSENAIADQIQNQGYCYYLIEDDSQPVGYFSIIQEKDSLFLSKLYVHKSKRGRGIASQALEFIKNIAFENKLVKITLTVNKNNVGPLAAYQKLGFVNKGSIVQDIGGGFIMDDYKMELKLI